MVELTLKSIPLVDWVFLLLFRGLSAIIVSVSPRLLVELEVDLLVISQLASLREEAQKCMPLNILLLV